MLHKKIISLKLDYIERMLRTDTILRYGYSYDMRDLDTNIPYITPVCVETMLLNPNFEPLPDPDKRIYTTGSGTSAFQAQFLAELLNRFLNVKASFVLPLSLKVDSRPKAGETVIFFSQRLSESTKSQIEHYRAKGVNVIVFTARYADDLPDDVQTYKFLPPHSFRGGEKTIVPVIGPMSSYLLIIRYVFFLMRCYGLTDKDFGLREFFEVYDKLSKIGDRFARLASIHRLDQDTQLGERPVIIIASGLDMIAAQHIALALTEGALMDVHAYEMENYTHGLRFFDRDQPRTFIVLKNLDNKPYYRSTYPPSIFTEGHKVIEFFSSLDEPLRILEYMMLAFHLLLHLTKLKKINLKEYPGKRDPRTRNIHKIEF